MRCNHGHDYLAKRYAVQPKLPKRKPRRFLCDILECCSSFGRRSDLARHMMSIHGPKQQCEIAECKYATGRRDKMVEHMRKRHHDCALPPLSKSDQQSGVDKRGYKEFMDASQDNVGYIWGDTLLTNYSCVDDQMSFSCLDIVPQEIDLAYWNESLGGGLEFTDPPMSSQAIFGHSFYIAKE